MTAAQSIIYSLSYQVRRPAITTMGGCPRCGNTARGGGVCADCLTESLPTAMQSLARQWRDDAERAARAWETLERMAEKQA